MMQEFLKGYEKANNLDDKQYDNYFPQGVKRADFLLFDGQVVCEVKETRNIKVQHQVEKQFSKGDLSGENFKRNFYSRINHDLSEANKQIRDSKKALDCPDAIGLVVLENLIKYDLSILSLIDASQRKMLSGLEHVDGVLCLDMVNTFLDSDGKLSRPSQLGLRGNEKSARLSELVQQLMGDFCEHLGMPFNNEFHIKSIEQVWRTKQGEYRGYEAKFDLRTPTIKVTPDWKKQLANFLNRWWYIIPLASILYDCFIR